jgi:cytochrome c peroxidase
MKRFVVLLAVVSLSGCDKRTEESRPAPPVAPAAPPRAWPAFDAAQLNFFAPLPEPPPIDAATKLGHRLFFDARLGCATCHDVTTNGAGPKKGKRDTPTVFNAVGAYAQGWDGRWSTLEELVVPHAAEQMGTDEKKLVAALGKPADAISSAVAAYVKRLLTPARFDEHLRSGNVLTEAELDGVAAFVDAGCPTCHQGKYIGATQAQKLGVAKPWPGDAGKDPGRFEVTKQESDRGLFKVPSLRNVTKTAPYLHDGSVATLQENVRLMARHQTGKELGEAQVKAIVAFLGTLAGDPPKDLAKKP